MQGIGAMNGEHVARGIVPGEIGQAIGERVEIGTVPLWKIEILSQRAQRRTDRGGFPQVAGEEREADPGAGVGQVAPESVRKMVDAGARGTAEQLLQGEGVAGVVGVMGGSKREFTGIRDAAGYSRIRRKLR